MARQPAALCYGHDESLLNTRRWLLERMFRVYTASHLMELAPLKAAHCNVDLLLVCQTVPIMEYKGLLELTHELWPHVQVLVMQTSTTRLPQLEGHEAFNSSDGPFYLMQKLSEMLAR